MELISVFRQSTHRWH